VQDKLGIVRPHHPLVTAEHKWGVLRLVEATCTHLNARLVRVGRDVTWRLHAATEDGTNATFITWRGKYPVRLSLLGVHQLANFGCALAAAELLREMGWEIGDEAIVEGAQNAHCHGRLQLVRLPKRGNLRVLLDGAHNPSGATTLARALRTLFRYRKLLLVFGVLADKEAAGIAAKLVPLADSIVVTQPQSLRALPAEKLAQICQSFGKPVIVCPTVAEALKEALAVAASDDLVCVTGSLYVVGEALQSLEGASLDIAS